MWPIIPGITTHMPLYNKENPPECKLLLPADSEYSLNSCAQLHSVILLLTKWLH